MTKITQIVEELPGIQNDLETLKISTNELRVNASQLNDGRLVCLWSCGPVVKLFFLL